MDTILLGSLALTTLLVAGICIHYKKPFLSFLCSFGCIVLTIFTAISWRAMLIGSGKDPNLLGFNRYPAAVIILGIMLLLAVVGIFASIIILVGKRRKG